MAFLDKLVKLQEVTNIKVRNTLRGITSSKDRQSTENAFGTLNRVSTPHDFKVAHDYLRGNHLAQHVPLPAIFPSNVSDVNESFYLPPGRYELELAAHKSRLELAQSEVTSALKSIKEISKAIFAGQTHKLHGLLATHYQEFGTSISLSRKILSFKHSASGENFRINNNSVTDPLFFPKRNILAVAFEDSIHIDRPYERVRRTFRSYRNRRNASEANKKLITDLFPDSNMYDDDWFKTLHAYGRWGVIDSLSYLQRLVSRAPNSQLSLDIRSIIPRPIQDAWIDTWSQFTFEDLIGTFEVQDGFLDYRAFRHSPAWMEIDEVRNFREEVEAIFANRLNGQFTKNRTSPKSDTHNLDDYLFGDGPPIVLSGGRKISGNFSRTVKFAQNDLSSPRLKPRDGKQLAKFLNLTIDIPSYFSKAELDSFLPCRKYDRLYEYLRTALLADQEDSRLLQHKFRRATQEIILKEFNGSPVAFLKSLHEGTPEVALHFYSTCTEFFLTELYHLFNNSDEVSEAHADLMEWYGTTYNDNETILRAKSARLNLSLRRVRGSIDDTRIYVDPTRFFEWALDNISSHLREMYPTANVLLEEKTSGLDLGNEIEAIEQPKIELLRIFDECYRHFCTNKFYGVDSYLGRRIRHGTLDGVLISEVTPTVENIRYDTVYIAPDLAQEIEAWFCRLKAEVGEFGAERLHVKSNDRPRGLISPTIADQEKRSVVLALYREVSTAISENRPTAHIVSLIYEYCWLLLEVDLDRTRSAAEKIRAKFVIDPSRLADLAPYAYTGLASEISRTLNTELQNRFGMLSGWLSRPSTISPTASLRLLFHAVLNEVENRHGLFTPQISETGTPDIDLYGHRFHSIYDALFVLVDNAAKHGKPDGELSFDVHSTSRADGFVDLIFSIASEVPSDNEFEFIARIEEAMNSDLQDALIREGRSGLSKIRTLVCELEEFTSFTHRVNDRRVTFSITVKLPSTVISSDLAHRKASR